MTAVRTAEGKAVTMADHWAVRTVEMMAVSMDHWKVGK